MGFYEEDISRIVDDAEIRKSLKDKCVAITGASGMIGTVLVDALMKMNDQYGAGIHVLAMSRNRDKLEQRFGSYLSGQGSSLLTIVPQDIMVEFDPGEFVPDLVIHAASNTHPREYSGDPVGTIMTNVLGTRNILEWMKGHKNSRFVQLSSVEIYGTNNVKAISEVRSGTDADKVSSFSEEDMGYINCNTLRAGYPESKRVCEAMVQAYIAAEGVDAVTLRLCRVYGATLEKDDSKALSQFLRKGCNKEDIVLKSSGNQLFSYIHVVDAVRAILTIACKGATGEAYNVASPDSDIQLRDLAALIASIAGTEVVFDLPDEMERKGYSTADVAILNADKLRHLGWSALYPIEEGIRRTMAEMAGSESGM